ncbi:MAG: hypothetical protein ACLUKN_07490 [Bacilli bacterium]
MKILLSVYFNPGSYYITLNKINWALHIPAISATARDNLKCAAFIAFSIIPNTRSNQQGRKAHFSTESAKI